MYIGFCAPTSGTIEVCGYDLSNSGSINTIREMIGVCPQYNLQFDVFTVKENILLFAGIKLLSQSEALLQVSLRFHRLEIQVVAFILSLNFI